MSCWSELEAGQQDELMASLEQALVVPDLPEISQTILNLAEFMEHCDNKGPLPLDPSLLGEQAMKCRAYAKVRVVFIPVLKVLEGSLHTSSLYKVFCAYGHVEDHKYLTK